MVFVLGEIIISRNNPKQHKSREKKSEVKPSKVLLLADDVLTPSHSPSHTQGLKQSCFLNRSFCS